VSISEVEHHVESPDAKRPIPGPPPDANRLRLHHSLREKIGITVADDLMEFLPPGGWGDLARRSDVEVVERRLDAKIDALGARLDARIDALEARIDGLEQQISQLRDEVRALGNLRTTIVLTGASLGISLFVGLGGLMVAIVQLAG
jgi:hypothetical protein